jgi:zinc protease
MKTLKTVVSNLLRFSLLCVVSLGVALSAQGPDRTKIPAPGVAPTVKLPAIQKRQLNNGLAVWLVELHEVPVVQVNLVVLTGSADDPQDKFGVASMTADMLENGAGSRSALQISDDIDFLGAQLETASNSDSTAVRLHVPLARLADALPIMADVSMRPTFPAEELERLRQDRLTSIIEARDDPGAIAALGFSRVLYGATHRFGTAINGTVETITSMTPADIRRFYTSHYRPDNATLVVVGDVTMNTVLPLLEARFGSWTAPAGSAVKHATLPDTSARAQREIYLVDKPGAPQSQIRIGSIGVPRSTPDYFPIQIMNTMLGGSFSSRLNMNLREKHGYAYGAFSVFDMRVAGGSFYSYAGVQTDKTSEAVSEFFNELKGIAQAPPQEELARAKSYVALRFPERFETTGDISNNLEDLLVYHLPDDYFSRYVQNIQAVTTADVQRVAQKYIQPDRFIAVVVGDRKTIEPGIRALNLGTVKPLSIDDIFGPAPR